MADVVSDARTGFWRRAAACIVDGCIVGLALQALALVAFPLTEGRVQAGGGVNVRTCKRLGSPPAGLEVPAEFQANFAVECVSTLFALPTGRTATVGRITKEGSLTKTVSLTVMVDREGRVVS